MDSRTLEISAFSEAIFETYVVTEIIKTYINEGLNPKLYLYYYRDTNHNEVDFIIVRNNSLHPIEIKKSTNPGKKSIRNFNVLRRSVIPVSEDGVICMCDQVIPIDEKNNFIPISCI